MVSRRRSVALLVCLVLAGLLLRGLLGVERPVRDSEGSPAEASAPPRTRPSEAMKAVVQAALPEGAPHERRALAASEPPQVPAETPALERPAEAERGSVLVSVLDADGFPASGLQIGFWTQLEDPEHPLQDSASLWDRRRSFPADQGVTDADGSVRLRYSLPTGLERPYFRTLIQPQLAFQELPRSETGPGVLPAPVVVLRLPPTGTVRVRVVPDELSVRGTTSVEARLCGRIQREARVLKGEALLPFVELGCELELRLTTAAMVNRPTLKFLRGPEVPGEVVEAELALEPWPLLRFRVRDESGQPLANSTFAVRIHHGRLSPQPGSVTTDTRGEADFVVLGDARNDAARELLLWSHSPARLARVWLPDVLATPTELGNITLQRVAPGSVPPP